MCGGRPEYETGRLLSKRYRPTLVANIVARCASSYSPCEFASQSSILALATGRQVRAASTRPLRT
jgi:hypothetical protein